MCPDESYTYTSQPPSFLPCNPYLNRELKLDCAVTGPDVVKVRWYYNTEFNIGSILHEGTIYLANSSKHLQMNHSISGGVGLTLTISNLTDNDAGSYWCQPFAADGSFYLSASSSLSIRKEEFYGEIPFECIRRALRNAETGCATTRDFPEPVSTIPPSSFVDAVLSSISATTSSLPLSSLPSTTSTYSPSPTPHAESPSALSGLNSSASSSSSPSSELPTARPESNISQIILYAVLGLVGFLAIICILLCIIIVRLCRKRSQKIGLEGEHRAICCLHIAILHKICMGYLYARTQQLHHRNLLFPITTRPNYNPIPVYKLARAPVLA